MSMNLEISPPSAFLGFYRPLQSLLPLESGSHQKLGGLTTHITMVFLLPGFDQL